MIYTLKDNRSCVSWLVEGNMDYFCILLWNGKIFLAWLFVLRSFVILTMTGYDYSISQNIQIGVIITPKHMLTKQRPARLSCSQKTCTTAHMHTNLQQKGGWHRGHICLFTAILPLYVPMCLWIVLRCLFIMLRLINSSPLSPCCWLGLSYV